LILPSSALAIVQAEVEVEAFLLLVIAAGGFLAAPIFIPFSFHHILHKFGIDAAIRRRRG
jgi:hypothetical protein